MIDLDTRATVVSDIAAKIDFGRGVGEQVRCVT